MSGLLDQFFIKYLTNAKEAAKDTLELDAAEKKLTENIKKQTEEEKKRAKEVETSARAMGDLVAQVTSAAAAYIGLNAVRSGIVKAADFNNTLVLESKLLGQNAGEISALGATMEQFGGSAQEFQGWLNSLTMEYAAMGREIPKVETLLRSVNREIAGRDRTEQLFILSRYGINNAGMQRMLMESPEEFDRVISRMKELRPYMEEGGDASREWTRAWQELSTAAAGVSDVLAMHLLPIASDVARWVTEFISDNTELVAGLTAVTAGILGVVGALAAGGLISSIAKAIPLLGGMAAKFAGIATAIGAIGAAVIANPIVLAILGIGTAAYMGYKALSGGDATVGGGGSSFAPNAASARAMAFWKSQGYTDAQAAGWVANMMRESSGDPGAIGDGGRARGLFQWHPDRQRGILKGTGIDVRTAGFEDQLQAAAWEAQKRGDADLVRQAQSADHAAEIISRKFERPANADYEARKRGQMANELLKNAQSSMSVIDRNQIGIRGAVTSMTRSSNNKVDVGGITVTTQATDPQAVADLTARTVNNQVNQVMANYDDAEAY